MQTANGPRQTSRSTPSYLLYLCTPATGADEVSASISMSGCRAKAFEGLRLRCVDRACRMRPEEERKKEEEEEATDGVLQEIAVEDQEGAGDGEEEYKEESNDAEEDEIASMLDQVEEERTVEGGSSKKYLVDLFTFSKPVSHYRRILSQVGQAAKAGRCICCGLDRVHLPTPIPIPSHGVAVCLPCPHFRLGQHRSGSIAEVDHLFVVTRTAHPSLLVAGRHENMQAPSPPPQKKRR